MVTTNGYFTTKTITSGGFDEDGQPVAATTEDGGKFDCRIQTVTDDKRGSYEDGKFKNHSFILFIPLNTTFSANHIEVFINELSVGSFTVQSIEHLKLVGVTKLTV